MGYPIEEGSIKCDAPGQNASYDSIISCVFFQIPFKLELIGFGYICLALIIPIIFISIFGKIKEQYRWFILNQAIWDLLITYDFICEKPTWYGYYQRQGGPDTFFYSTSSSCFYGTIGDGSLLFAWTKDAIKHISYLPLFLLTFSRFICLYNHQFYLRHSGTLKLILIIVIFNLIFLFFITFRRTYGLLVDEDKINREHDEDFRECHFSNCHYNKMMIMKCNQKAIDACVSKLSVYDPFWPATFEVVKQMIAIIFLILSLIFSTLIAAKVSHQLKFHFQHNRSNLQTTFRISAVCLFQSFTMFFMLLLILFSSIKDLYAVIPGLNMYEFFDNLPSWASLLQESFTVQSFNIIKVFLDSFIVLTVLNGYRRNLKVFIVFIFNLIIKNSKNILYTKNLSSSKITAVSTISITTNHKT